MPVKCFICCENVDFSNEEISVLHCGHLFHRTCLQQWLSTNRSCPDCRAKVCKHGFVKKIYPKVNSTDEISYDGVSNETKRLFEVYEEQTKNIQKRFIALEKELSNEKLSHGETLKDLEQERNDSCGLRSDLENLKIEIDDIRSAKNNLRLENESLKKNMSLIGNVVLNHSTSKF